MAQAKKKVLVIAQMMQPFADDSEMSMLTEFLPHTANSKGMEVRIMMPKYGVINERRHRLHEVVRLSGMNIIVDDNDYPLVIKVASLPNTRMQVYFLDNNEFFKRKEFYEDKNGVPFEDNADRMVFFCKGVIETVKKFGWAPDIIHCHGFMTSLVPFYLRTAYKNEPLFRESKIICSLYNEKYDKVFDESFLRKGAINQLTPADLEVFRGEDGIDIFKGVIACADGVAICSEEISEEVILKAEKAGKPYMPFVEGEEILEAQVDFYETTEVKL
jgi:starch synthase